MTDIPTGSCHTGAVPVPFPTFPSDTPAWTALPALCPQHSRTDRHRLFMEHQLTPVPLEPEDGAAAQVGPPSTSGHAIQGNHSMDPSPTAPSQCSFPVHPAGPPSQLCVACKEPRHRHMSWWDHSPLAQQGAPPPQNRVLNTLNPSEAFTPQHLPQYPNRCGCPAPNPVGFEGHVRAWVPIPIPLH